YGWLDAVHPDDREQARQTWKEAIAMKVPASAEVRLRSIHGDWRWSTVKAAPLFNADGTVRKWVGMNSDIAVRIHAEEIVRNHANFDTLTQLPNRRLFRDRLEQIIMTAQRHDESVAVLFIDLDGFKQVNDLLGHDVGDELLIEAAKRLQHCVR